MNFYHYFQSYDNYFWQWEDNGEVLAIPGDSTIAYRAFIGEVYQKIIPQGIPPFGSLLLAIIATNPDSKDSLVAVNRLLQKLMTENERAFIDRVFSFLHVLSEVPKEYKTGNKRIILLQSIFQSCHNILSADNSKRIFGNYFSAPIDKPLLLKKEKFSSHVFVRDLRTLELIGQKLPTVNDIIDRMAGLPELKEEIEIPVSVEESSVTKDFVEELIDHTKTFHVGSLIKRLWSGLNIPVHASQPSQQPIGGISDLTNKGDFDKLLLSEFANDDLVFLSRLANNEALYIHREIPPANNDFQRVILIDVSLKNWGTPKTSTLR